VTLYDSWREHVDAIRRNGLHLDGITGDFRIEIPATNKVEEIDPCEIAIVLVDANATREAGEVAGKILSPSGYALTLQNGIGNVEALAASLGAERVLAGLSFHSGALAGPGHITHTHAGPTYLGEIGGSRSGRLANLVTLFEGAGFKPVPVGNIIAHIWEKWIHNCAINAISAVSGLRVGEIARSLAADEFQSRVIEEALAIVGAKGINLPEPDPAGAIKAFCRIKFNKPSMLQHMEEGRQTEIDALNGALVRIGRELGIATPYNDALTLIVKAKEAFNNIHASQSPIDYDAVERQAKEEFVQGKAA
jgi:2-dehydropantoate 2-reductase